MWPIVTHMLCCIAVNCGFVRLNMWLSLVTFLLATGAAALVPFIIYSNIHSHLFLFIFGLFSLNAFRKLSNICFILSFLFFRTRLKFQCCFLWISLWLLASYGCMCRNLSTRLFWANICFYLENQTTKCLQTFRMNCIA